MAQEDTEGADAQGGAPAKKPRKKRLRGFPSLIWGQLQVLNTSDYFKQKYGQDRFRLLLVATDDKTAALVIVADGQVQVEGVPNEPAELKQVKRNGLLVCTTDQFFAIAMGKLDPVKAWLKRQIKIRGFRTLLKFSKYFGVIAHCMKQATQAQA
jgi:putative sterol carrier protein